MGAAMDGPKPMTNGHGAMNGVNGGLNGMAHSMPAAAATPQPSTAFTPNQLFALRSQIQAFKLIQRGVPIPDVLQEAIHPEGSLANDAHTSDPVVDAAVRVHKGLEDGASAEEVKLEETGPVPPGPYIEDDTSSSVYPYNAFTHPFSYLAQPNPSREVWATKMQRLLLPSIMPPGLDPHQILAERNRFVEARIEQRIRELAALPSTMGEGGLENPVDDVKPDVTAHGKLRAMIELKALRLRDKQRALRASLVERLGHSATLPVDRREFKRYRKPSIRDTRTTEHLERRQRQERERRAKQKHLDYLNVICSHGRDMVVASRAQAAKAQRIGKAVLRFHEQTEKEEQKRIERISRERLRALKADDEEAYLKLIDTAKDTRITHLLRQTDSYLDSLSAAVVAQQNADPSLREQLRELQETGGADETMFGATKSEDAPTEKGKLDYYAIAHRIQEKITQQPTILQGGKLKEYQIKGLQWMVSLYNNRLNGILADEMGLGKTIQTISLVTFLIESKKQPGPYLIIVPLSTLTNWTLEFQKWAPSVKLISYKGSPQNRRMLQNDIRMGQFQVLLTTYEYIIKDRPILCKMRWVHMIIDEGHRMKNANSKLAQTLAQYYHSRYRLILTGTPLQNNLPELWALLNFVLPKVFNSAQSFEEWFNTPFANTGGQEKIELNEEEVLLIIRRLHKVLRPFLLRRLKKDVESELPDKVEKVIKCKLSGLQGQLYKQMKKHGMLFAEGKDAKGKQLGLKGLNNALMQMRKICQHPYLFEEVEAKINPGGMIDEKIVRVSGKFELLSRILPKLFKTGHRVLIFFQMTKVMDIMSDFMNLMGYKHLRLDGSTKTDERANYVQLFNAPNSEYLVFLLSTRAGGLGLNLQTADTVVIFDSDWNPHADLQAQDRAHRIGQTKAVRILRFITEKSVEEAMFARARFKLAIDGKVIQAGKFDNKSTDKEQEEVLRSILEADQEQDESEESSDMTDEELNMLLARSDEEVAIFRELDVQREVEAERRWRERGNVGPRPPPLMAVEELPEIYQRDEPFVPKEDEEVKLEGRGQRKRNTVNYNDGIDDPFLAEELGAEEDFDEPPTRKRGRPSKIGSGSGTNTPQPDPRGKRKRPAKASSVTPSMNDEDEDDLPNNKRRKTGTDPIDPATRARMKRAFDACYKAVQQCEDEHGRKRCELFKELPSRHDYPDYYQTIAVPIAMSHMRKRASTNYYKTVTAYLDDWRLMFNNARTYNQEGSWVYIDANEMQKVLEDTFRRETVNSGLPGAEGAAPVAGPSGGYGGNGNVIGYGEYVDEEGMSRRGSARPSAKRVVISDDEYMSAGDSD
ncbi:hypothetical protein EXIGLDRAFT_742051 [Exidia glandulosa HHB12029]|uniref:SNF2-family ATP dependent chromatin remodeling factor snf21 n=1 Tax=Exidia glandulosa HHB12029 TaxID=1314781 RepID=A0A165D6R1_EXIGL|nr:hypothetical protein EXIGLDRAFT_742051 [Exidia glandulosa HHB12029]